jgi:hypothetical protein
MGGMGSKLVNFIGSIKLMRSNSPCPRKTDFDAVYKKPNSVYLTIPRYSPRPVNKNNLAQMNRMIYGMCF